MIYEASICFNGTPGTATGTWNDRIDFYTGAYTATFKYEYNGVIHSEPNFPPNTTAKFASGVLVIGKSATIN